jgi:organic radical activating enzyme
MNREELLSAIYNLGRKPNEFINANFNKKSRHRKYFEYYHQNFQPIPENIYESSLEKPTFRMLSIHSHNGCNLACRGCNHHSGMLSPGSGLSIDQLLKDLEILLPRINVWSHASVLGGEALIEPRSEEVVTFLEDFYQGSVFIKIFSNGLLLKKNQEWIIDHMKRGTICRLSLHNSPITKIGKRIYSDVDDFISLAQSEGVDLHKTLEISEPWDDYWFDLLKFDGKKLYPHEDGDINESFAYCTAPNLQIYSGKLWKCPSIAYLKETLASTNQLNDEVWQKYLNYEAIPVDAPIEDIFDMAKQVMTPHEICNKCPSKPKWFPAYRQLNGVKNVVSQIDDPV